jgi:hypothetical protein
MCRPIGEARAMYLTTIIRVGEVISPTQERPPRCLHARPIGLPVALLAAVAALLAGCSNGASVDPVDWWHSLEDGPLADARPPPPNVDQPYPYLGSIPPKPPAPDLALRDRLDAVLGVDRANAEYSAALAPLEAPVPAPLPGQPASAQPAAPAAAGQGPAAGTAKAAPAPDDTSSASLQAATAPPPPAPPPTTPPAARPPAVATAPGSAPLPPVKVIPDTTALLPDMPGGPPALPVLSGVSLPVTVAPGVYPVAPAKPAAALAPPTPGAPVPIAFTPGSAVVPTDTKNALAALVANRGNAAIMAIGYGDAASSEAQAQADALPLALARARAIAIGLIAAGVPSGSVIISAEAQGAGGEARLATN